MKLKSYIILFPLVLLLCSCGVSSFYVYVHEPTEDIKRCVWANNVNKEAKCLKGKDLVLIPDFRAFTPSFSRPHSRVIVYSKFNDPIFISKAILKVKGENTETELKFNKEFPYRESLEETGYQTVIILLFDEENTDFKKYEMKNELELEIHYKATKVGEDRSETFELMLEKTWDFIWPT